MTSKLYKKVCYLLSKLDLSFRLYLIQFIYFITTGNLIITERHMNVTCLQFYFCILWNIFNKNIILLSTTKGFTNNIIKIMTLLK